MEYVEKEKTVFQNMYYPQAPKYIHTKFSFYRKFSSKWKNDCKNLAARY